MPSGKVSPELASQVGVSCAIYEVRGGSRSEGHHCAGRAGGFYGLIVRDGHNRAGRIDHSDIEGGRAGVAC